MKQANSSEQGTSQVKNGLPRVAWTGITRDGTKYRLVLVGDGNWTEKYPGTVRPGEVVMLEVAIEASALRAEQWQRIRYEQHSSGVHESGSWSHLASGALEVLIHHAMLFDGPHCTTCGDCGALQRDGMPPVPCTACERGAQLAGVRRSE